MLGFAGIQTPSYMDGKSIVPVIVEPTLQSNAAAIPDSVLKHLHEAGAPPQRVASFHEYYNQVNIHASPLKYSKRHPCSGMLCIRLLNLSCRARGRLVLVTHWMIGATPTLGYITKGPRASTNVREISRHYPSCPCRSGTAMLHCGIQMCTVFYNAKIPLPCNLI